MDDIRKMIDLKNRLYAFGMEIGGSELAEAMASHAEERGELQRELADLQVTSVNALMKRRAEG